ncbi:MAG: S8 family serine peptidase [Chloroflexi bacterium]|nr:S8 family serine peptidase [Chloroflexota bacterium]
MKHKNRLIVIPATLFILFLVVALFYSTVGATLLLTATAPEQNILSRDLQIEKNLDAAAVDVAPTGSKFAFQRVEGGVVQVPDPNTAVAYIVMLDGDPLVAYKGGVDGLEATNPSARGEMKIDADSAATAAYLDYLNVERADAIQNMEGALGRSLKLNYEYNITLFGFSTDLTPIEAAQMMQLDGVRNVELVIEEELYTDSGPGWVGAPGIWDGSDSPVATKGEGVIVGVIDTGIDPWNPSFLDVGDDGYDHTNPWGAGTYAGVCDPTNLTPPISVSPYDSTFPCNDKLIGAWGYSSVNGGTPRDSNGHGSHTASTSAGNVVYGTAITTVSGVYTNDISGVAPHANIVAYAACCASDALAFARDQVVLDGVDVVNYSIGTDGATPDPWNSSSAVQWLNVRDAGIFVATSAGNDGPGDETVSSPGDLPWITTVGASSHNRAYINSITLTNGVSPTLVIQGQSLTGGYGPETVVYAGDYSSGLTGTPELCGVGNIGDFTPPWPPGTFNGEIVVCDRGGFGRVEKGANVLVAGAGGYILAQPNIVGGGPGSLATDFHALPASHIEYATYQILQAFMAAGTTTGTIGLPNKVIDDSLGDIMASFSSRGANRALPDIIVPNITAPGRAIWAAYSQGAGGDGDYTYTIIQGTSMSSPHMAGAAALMRAVHPDWTPAQIESALMTTARTSVLNDDGIDPTTATPFDQGSGHVDLGLAANAALVLDVTTQEFQDAETGDPKDLNIASMGNNGCVQTCSWTRTLSNTQAASVDWTASQALTGYPSGITVTVQPSNFTIPAHGTQVITVTADVTGQPIGQWVFGDVLLTATGVPTAHLPVAAIPSTGSLPGNVDIDASRNAGSVLVEDLQAIEILTLTVDYIGLKKADIHYGQLTEADTSPGFPAIFYANLATGLAISTTTNVVAGSYSLIYEVADTTSPDLDMLVGRDNNGNGQPDPGEEVCTSASGGSFESCKIDSPTGGLWWSIIINYAESANTPDDIWLAAAAVEYTDEGNMTVTGPSSVSSGTPFDLRLFYDENMAPGDRYYGAFSIGSQPSSPGDVGIVPVTLIRHQDDVIKTADAGTAFFGDTVNYTVTIGTNITPEDLYYMITDTIPAGLTYVPGSVSASQGTASEAGGVITWDGSVSVPGMGYAVSTSSTDPSCVNLFTGSAGYPDLLTLLGWTTSSSTFGDNIAWNYSGFGVADFYGQSGLVPTFTDDGYTVFGTPAFSPTPQNMPNPALPNNVGAPLWFNFEVVYDSGLNKGVTAGAIANAYFIVEFDDVQPVGDPSRTLDFTIEAQSPPGPGPDVVYSYDNIVGSFNSGAIGVENNNGTEAVNVAYGTVDSVISDGLNVCFDWVPFGDPVTITYQATVDASAASPLTNYVDHSVDNPGSAVETAWHDLYILGDADKSVSSTLVDPGDLLTYTVAITAASGANMYDLSDTIPSGFNFVNVNGATYWSLTNSIEWSGWLGSGFVTVTEGFESAYPPAGWVLTQTGDVGDPGWVQTTLRANSGTYSAYHNDDSLIMMPAIAWLISPQIDVPAGGGDFTFWQNENLDTWIDYHGIWVSTASNNPADFVELVNLPAGTEDTWEQLAISMNAYAGQSIYMAFRYEGNYADEWYIDDVAYPSNLTFPNTKIVTLTLQAATPGFYTNIANIQTQGQTTTVAAPEVEIYGAAATWDKDVWINGTYNDWADGPFTVYDGDTVEVVDYVSIDFNGAISYTLGEEWTDSLALSGYAMSGGSVITGTNMLDWSLTGGISNTWYVLTKTFTVNDYNGFADPITETLNVSQGGLPQMRLVGFNIPMEAEIVVDATALASTQMADTQISQTVTISNPGNINLDWSAYDSALSFVNALFEATPDKVDSNTTEVADGLIDKSETLGIMAVGDELFQIDAGATTGHAALLGVEYANGSWWVTSAGATSPGDTNYLFELDDTGAVVNSWQQGATSVWGWRDLAFDGTYLYASDSALLEQIDPATGLATGTTIPCPISPCRAMAYDPVTDNFWTASFSSDIYEFDRTGTIISQFSVGLAGKYGMAWDPNGPFLWAWSQDGSGVQATQIEPTAGITTGVVFQGSAAVDGIAGGATIVQNGPCEFALVGMHQMASDTFVGYDLGVPDLPWASVSPTSGSVPRDTDAMADVTFDSTGMANGVYTGTMCIRSNDPVTPQVEIPLTMTVASYGVDLSGNAAMSGNPGDVVTYTLTVTNTGSVADTYTVAISDTWGATAPVSVTVGAGVTGTFDVAVTVPAGASDGDSDAATVTVTSVNDAAATDSADLTTTAVQTGYTLYLPVIMKP